MTAFTGKSILICGVGGQGTLLMSKTLTYGLVQAGYDVKMSEVHGMAQRGGSVSTQVRYGEKVYSPIIGRGEADVLVAFEKLEAVRYANLLKPGGAALINDYEIAPLPVASGAAEYPQNIEEQMRRAFQVRVLPASRVAKSLGNIRCTNIVLLGALVRAFALETIDWNAALTASVPPKALALNIAAFDAGYQLEG
ncbi:MAG: indolepyruvate oxidoreductase subunit beta [Clostridiales bacterium]|nr:indolepyruvate oxidoreductase subunit beta [Clostridiales bacterium]